MPQNNIIESLTGGWNTSDIRISNLSDSINMFLETTSSGASSSSILRSIAGTSLLLDISNRPCRGIFESSNSYNGNPILFTVFANEVYVIYNEYGTYYKQRVYNMLNNLDTPVSICETGGEGSASPHVVIADGSNIAVCNTKLLPIDMDNPDLDGFQTIALPYTQNQEDKEHPSERIRPTHVAYCYNYLICNDYGTDAFYITYQYPFERTYNAESVGKQSYIDSVKYSISKVSTKSETNVVLQKIDDASTNTDIAAIKRYVYMSTVFDEAEKTQIQKLLQDLIDYQVYTLRDVSSLYGETDMDVFMVNPWRIVEAGYADYGFVTYADWSPDNTIALCSNGTYLYTFGPKSSQIFTYTSDVEAPFSSPTNSAKDIGIKAIHSLATVGNYAFFLGSSSIGEGGVYYWEGNQIKKVSNPDIERKINSMKNINDAFGQVWQENGHLFYALTFVEGDYTLVYDILENSWHRRSTKDTKTNAHHAWRPRFATMHYGRLLFGTNDGCLIYLDDKKFTEYDGRPILRIRRSGMLMNNYQPFIVDSITLVCNTGDHTDPNMNPNIMMRFNEAGGEWSNQEIGLLGVQGAYDTQVQWFRSGLHRIMAIEISCSDPVNFAIVGGKIEYTLIDRR